MTIRERVWRALKERGPMTVFEITCFLGLPHRPGTNNPCKVASDALNAMIAARHVSKRGKDKSPKYRAIGKAPPGRGSHPNSIAALLGSSRCKSKSGPNKPEPATALEEAWGWMPRTPAYPDCAGD